MSLELYLQTINEIIGVPTEHLTMIDLCCGEMTATRHLKFRDSVHVDVKDWPNRPKEFKFVQADVRSDHTVFNTHYDVALCSDGIEHLQFIEAAVLLGKMRGIAKLAIVFTPMGECTCPYDPLSDNPDVHKSIWTPEAFKGVQWRVKEFPDWHGSFGAFFAWK